MTEESIEIGKSSVVTFHYSLLDENGKELENSSQSAQQGGITGGEPILYLHGYNGMMAGIEAGLEGKKAGDNVSVTLGPDDAYGRRSEAAKGRVPLKNVKLPGQQPIKGKLAAGTVVEVRTEKGIREATVIKQGLKAIDIDTNHPYVDMTLTFNINVIAVRAATEQEMEHGHAHASGGCGH